MQTPLAMQHLVMTAGIFPQPDSGAATDTVGMIRFYAGMRLPGGTVAAQGQELEHPWLPYIMHGIRTERRSVTLPDPRARSIVGLSAAGTVGEGDAAGHTLALRWLIATHAPFPQKHLTPCLGMLRPFIGPFVPAGWMAAEGQALPIEEFQGLYALLGDSFGSGHGMTFQLPDLRGRTPIGIGGSGPRLGQVVDADGVAGLGVRWLVSNTGAYPMPDMRLWDEESFFGEMIPVAFNRLDLHPDWLPADGTILPIARYGPLFSVVDNQFGGDALQHFALPDARGRRLTGA